MTAALRRLSWMALFSKRRRRYGSGYASMAAAIASGRPSDSRLRELLDDRDSVIRSLGSDPVLCAYLQGECAAVRDELSRRSVG